MAHTILHEAGELEITPRRAIPVARWSLLLAVAIGGSLLYGGSLGLVLPGWQLGGAALWLTLSTGLAWGVFIRALWLTTGLSLRRCLDACLVTMAAGEVVLAGGALSNAVLWWTRCGGLEMENRHRRGARWQFLEDRDAKLELCKEVEPVDYLWGRRQVVRVKPCAS